MIQEQWTKFDHYVSDLFVPSDPVLDAALEASAQAGLPEIQVSPNQGSLLSILARSIAARSILEIGTLGGYSTIWLARALPPDGKLISLEADPKHADVARANVARAGLDRVAEIRLGRAVDTLPRLAAEGHGPFDLVFIDADKPSTDTYFQWALKLTRRGSLIITDNVVRDGEVANADNTDASIQGIRRFNAAMAAERRIAATIIQTVGIKGYDGLALALVTADADSAA